LVVLFPPSLIISSSDEVFDSFLSVVVAVRL
jgi:hypothetical protein